MWTQWKVKAGYEATASNQMKAEAMGLCVPGDKYGAMMYVMGQADEHYPSWDTKTQIEKDDLVEKIKAVAAEVCVSALRYPLH